ncbi:large ribosomal subunit protein mL52 [Pelodytes ibericus]
MAAPLLIRQLQLRTAAVQCMRQRGLQSSAPQCAGQVWRIRHGFARSDSEYGPLTDLPDWSFADGRPAPPWKGHTKRNEEREAFTRRVILLSTEMEQGLKKWNENQQALRDEQLQKQKMQLKHKAVLKKKDKPQ